MPQFGATWHVVTHLDVGFRLTTMPKMPRAEIWLICRKWFSCSNTQQKDFNLKADLGYCNWKGVASTVADSLQSPLPQRCGSRLRAVDTGLFSKALDEAPQVQHFRRSQRDDFGYAGVAFSFFLGIGTVATWTPRHDSWLPWPVRYE